MPCSRRLADVPIRTFLALIASLLFCMPTAHAQDARFGYAAMQATSEAYVLEADVHFALNDRLVDAVQRGVPLYLVLEVEITRDRWYWFDEEMARRKRTYLLSYHPLTRSYRLTLDGVHENFDTLTEALQPLRKVRNWVITPRKNLKAGTSYDVSLRFRLDTSRLPKPFQVTALGSSDWTLDTDWLQWTFLATAPAVP